MNPDLQNRVRRITAHRSSMWVYRTVQFLIRVVLFPYFRLQHKGAEHLNMDGPMIVASVHRSNLDGPIIGGVTQRRLRALSKESLFSNKPMTAFMASLGAFPVRRGVADREALRSAAQILRAGEQMLVFPEGSRKTGPQVVDVFDGVSYLAYKTGAPVVPVGIAGTEEAMRTGQRLPRRVRVAVVVGPPVHPPKGGMSRPQITRFSETVTQSMQAVFDEAQSLTQS